MFSGGKIIRDCYFLKFSSSANWQERQLTIFWTDKNFSFKNDLKKSFSLPFNISPLLLIWHFLHALKKEPILISGQSGKNAINLGDLRRNRFFFSAQYSHVPRAHFLSLVIKLCPLHFQPSLGGLVPCPFSRLSPSYCAEPPQSHTLSCPLLALPVPCIILDPWLAHYVSNSLNLPCTSGLTAT